MAASSLGLLQLNDLLGWQGVFLHRLGGLQLGFLVIFDSILQIREIFSWSAKSYQLNARGQDRNYWVSE